VTAGNFPQPVRRFPRHRHGARGVACEAPGLTAPQAFGTNDALSWVMRTIAIGLLGIVLSGGLAAAQTVEERARVLRDFSQNVATYAERYHCLDPVHAPVLEPSPRIFTLPVAMVFRQLIAEALQDRAPATAMSGVANGPGRHLAVLEPLPSAELVEFPEVLADTLPVLPEPLEYRLIGRDLVVRDIQSAVIIGVLRDAVGAIATLKR
jgi:hypothetical protein